MKSRLARRHLTETQRALVAARLATLRHGGDRKSAKAKGENQEANWPLDRAAERLNVSPRSVKRAGAILTHGTPELVAAVERGAIRAAEGQTIARLAPRAQKEVVLTPDRTERRQKIEEAKLAQEAASPSTQRGAAPILITQRAKNPAERMYSVDEWTNLSPVERKDIIEAGFESRSSMNEQQTDSIEWARWSLNTVTGCLHSCSYCYARDIASRYFPQGFAPTFHPARLAAPTHHKIPVQASTDESFRNIFANSMSDLFGQWVPRDWIEATIAMATRNPGWNFLTLTKFPQRAAAFEYPDNWWMGTTVDCQARVRAAEKAFAKVQCGTKWLSVEPLLEPLTFDRLDLFQWIVIGGASPSAKTPKWTPDLDWIVDLHHHARAAGAKLYYKTNCGMSDDLRKREFPWKTPSHKKLPKPFRYLKGLGT